MNQILPTGSIKTRLLPLGDTAWTVEFGQTIEPDIHARVAGFAARLAHLRELGAKPGAGPEEALFAAIVDVVPTFRSLTVHYHPLRCDGRLLGQVLLAQAEATTAVSLTGRRWQIPVCFAEEFAPDLADLALTKGLSREAVIGRLTATEFRVYMIGFMPGFPYMGGLPAELHAPRLASPRQSVPARSLAVAGEMCAVYPWESPGGWRLLGRTPVPLFTLDDVSPSLLAAGDQVRWRAIDRQTYSELEDGLRSGRVARRSFLQTGGAA